MSARSAAASGRRSTTRCARARPLPVHHRARGARAREGPCGVLRRAPRDRLRERHRRAGAGADGEGHRPGRRGDLPVLHVHAAPPEVGRAGRRDAGVLPTSTRRPSTSTLPSLERAVASREGGRPEAEGRDAGRPVWPAGRLRRDHADRRAPTACDVLDDAAQAFGATYQGPQDRHARAGRRDQLLPGQAARLLRRRRRDLHRRRRARRHHPQPARARRGHRPLR